MRWTNEMLASVRPGADVAKQDSVAAARPKYGNKKVTIDGKKFDSKAEGTRYVELRRLQEGGVITGLKCQEAFTLPVNGALICKYIADFVYFDCNGARIVEDVKGVRTRDYIIKAKLMKAIHGIEIQEIRKTRRRG